MQVVKPRCGIVPRARRQISCHCLCHLLLEKKNYPSHKLEYLALKWAIKLKYHDHLYGHTFVVTTDNNPLTYALTTAKLDSVGHLWLAELSTYDFSIEYKMEKISI